LTPELPDLGAEKARWRRWANARRTSVDYDAVSAAIVSHLITSGLLRGLVLTYLAMSDEVDLAPLRGLVEAQWAVTRAPETGPLTVHVLDGPMERHGLGFEQPSSDSEPLDPRLLDVLLLPGLAFDRSGARLGRGRGYIDGLLSRVRPEAVTIGIAPEAVIVQRLPTGGHDRNVSHLASEHGITAFRAQRPTDG